MLPRRFALVRHVDYTGVSGVGVVAYGVVFADGHVVLRWASSHPATSLWDSLDDLLAVHGHGEATSIEWLDPVSDPFAKPVRSRGAGRRARRVYPDPVRPTPLVEPDPVAPPAEPDPVAPLSEPGPPPDPAPPRADPVPPEPAAPDDVSPHPARDSVTVQPWPAPDPPPPPPAESPSTNGTHSPHARLPAQRRPGRHRRAAAEQQSRTTQPIESDGS